MQRETSGKAAGLRTHIGNFTADARVAYNVMFASGFAGGREMSIGDAFQTGRYNGTLSLGTTF